MALPAVAQKMTLTKGSLEPLKGVTAVQIQFTYDNMKVGKDGSEATYVKRRTTELNDKEAGRGDTWAKQWVADRKERFEPKFNELFEKHAKMSPLGTDSKYLLIVHTTFTEPGFNVGVARRPAYIDAEVTLVEAADPSKVLAKVMIDNAPGSGAMGYDFDTGFRLQESYAKAGKELGQFITKKNKK